MGFAVATAAAGEGDVVAADALPISALCRPSCGHEPSFLDADDESKARDRRLISGGLVMCGGACGTWFSGTQKCVTLSTTATEYVWHLYIYLEGSFCC